MPDNPLPADVVDELVESLDIEMMRYVYVWELLGKEGPTNDLDKKRVPVCDGGSTPCMVLPISKMVVPEGSSRALRAAVRGLQKTWKTTTKLLVKRESKRLGVKGLDLGVAITKKGLQVMYVVHDPKHFPGARHAHPHPHGARAPRRKASRAGVAA
jgi:hypothetical protein